MRERTVSALLSVLIAVTLVAVPSGVVAPTYSADTLVVGVQNDTPNLHPWDIATNSVWKSFLWRQWVYEGLYGVSPDGTVYPVLAESLQVADPHNITVTIRSGVTFTDGTPMTVDDVVFSFQTLAFNSQLSDTILKSITWQDPPAFDRWNSSTAWASTHKSHVGAIKTGANTVRFQLRQDCWMFYSRTLITPIMPSHIWKDHLVEVDLSVFSLPDGSPITQGTEFDFDRNFGSQATDTQATIGTGPWYLVDWDPLRSLNLSAFGGYWGKSESVNYLGTDYPFFPRNVRRMEFRIYATLDEAVLALKAGEVHVVPWNLPRAYYDDLKSDPRIGFTISPEDGFIYMAFNMRRQPFADLNFREAVSHTIDKDFIVNMLLGGFGTKGQVPISPINPAYVNSSAMTPPFDLIQARAVLDAAGYIDMNGDGWREYPGGSPLHLEILTPTASYDPVRADSGVMISNNLKSIGVNVDSVPLAFAALVDAIFVSVDFDMYILGWVNLGMWPEDYLGEFFACSSDVLLGMGSNTPGFCDPGFEQKLAVMDTEMDNAKRIQTVKDAEGILTEELPYNTLYYLHQIEAYRTDVWVGWVPAFGEIFNSYSVNVLAHVPLPEYVPVDPLPSTSSTVLPSSQVPLSIRVLNQGNASAPANATVAFFNVTTPATPFANFTLAPLDSGMSFGPLAATWVAPSTPGTYQVAVNVDFSNNVTEFNETNNTYIWTFQVASPPVTDLVIGQPSYVSGATYVRTSTPLDFTVTDMSGKGIHNTTYRIDNASWVEYWAGTHVYLPAEGEHYFEWRSVDNVSNIEEIKSKVLRVDDSPPSTSANVGTPRYEGDVMFVRSTTLVSLTAIDIGAKHVGVKVTEYRFPGGQWTNYSTPFAVQGLDGLRKVEFRSTDLLGNEEGLKNITLFVDDTAPQTLLKPSTFDEYNVETTFEFTVVETGSGVDYIRYSFDGGSESNYTGKFQLPEGDHTIRFWSVDKLGNAEAANNVSITIKGKSSVNLGTVLVIAAIVAAAVIAAVLIFLRRRGKKATPEGEESAASKETAQEPGRSSP